MSLQVLHLVGTSLARLGWLTAIMSCGLPMWRVTTFPESETEVDVSVWEGLWHMCEVRGLGSMQCMSYRHRLAIPEDLHVSQVLMIVSIIISGLLFPLCVAVGECSSRVKNQIIGARLARWEAAMVLVSGLLLLASVSWITYNFDYSFYNPVLGSRQRTQLGASPYLGWVGSGLMLLGGGLLWSTCKANQDLSTSTEVSADRPSTASNSA